MAKKRKKWTFKGWDDGAAVHTLVEYDSKLYGLGLGQHDGNKAKQILNVKKLTPRYV